MSMLHRCLTNLRAIARAALLAAACVAVLAPTGVAAQQMSDHAAAQISALLAEKETRNTAQRKIDSQLLYASRMARGLEAAPGVPTLEVDIPVDHKGMVEIDIRAKVGGKVEQLVRDAGGYVVRTFAFGDSIEARAPLSALETIAGSDLVRFIAPKAQGVLQSAGRPIGGGTQMESPGMTPRLARFKETVKRAVDAANLRGKTTGQFVVKSGSVTSEGDATHRAADVRTTLGNNGAGMCIGVLSDSFDATGGASGDEASGNLPGLGAPFPFSQPVMFAGSGDSDAGADEGRAMLQIVHDLAPGARLYFATAFNGLLDFANNIRALRGIAASPGAFGNVFPKCDIVIDDVFYFVETGLHDGQPAPSDFNMAQVAQAVNDVVADGGMYFSSAGNSGNTTQVRPSTSDNTSGAWEGDYVGAAPPAALASYADALVWSGADVGNIIEAASSVSSPAPTTLQWSDPIGASNNDYDLCRLNSTLTSVITCSTNIQSGTQDPFEAVTTAANTRLVIVRKTGAAARFMSLSTNRGRLQYATTGQTRGHSASLLGMGVAATPAAATFGAPTPNGPFPNPFVGSNQIEWFSSDGPRRSFFNMDGSAITPGNFLAGSGGGTLRLKPDMTAADGVATTLPPSSGLNPFYGTSAAAPHAGAIAALIKQGLPNAAPLAITNIMKSTALDIMAPGPDKDSGAGIVQAFQAVQGSGGSLGAIVRPTAVNVVPFGGNTVLEPNECNTLNVPLINEGTAGATAVSATITSSTPGVALTKPNAAYANIASNGGLGANATPFEVSVSKSLACLSTATFTQTVQYTGGAAPRSFTFTLPVGAPQQYTFAAQPSVGLPPGATGPVAGSVGDDAVVGITVPAGFNFSVYGTAVTGGSTILASSNGNVQIQASGGSDEWTNTTLPSGVFTANPVLMPLWDDLRTDTITGGGIFTNLVGVAPNRQFVIEWRARRWDDGGTVQTLNFGVVFNEGSSTFEYRYPQTNNPVLPSGGGATVGVQNSAVAGQYTQFSYNQPNVPSGTVIRATLSAACAPAATGQCSTPLFVDVPNGYWSAREINTVYNTFPRVTNGCLASPLSFCPTDQVTREQIAAFIIRAKEGEPAANLCTVGGSPFPDVSPSSLFCPYIKRMQQLGITNGCGNGNYCPTALVTRETAVIMLIRALEGDPSPTLCSGGSPFTDVSSGSPWCPHILRAQQRGITNGCTPTTFCPLDNALRSEMAVFLVRAFGL